MDIKKSTSLYCNISKYELELNCTNDLYDFYAYTETGSLEASFNGLTKDELANIINFLQHGTAISKE